jgi:hypothetical protein
MPIRDLTSGDKIELRLDVKCEYSRDVVEAAGHNRFVKLLPEELASFQCRVSYKNAAECRFYSLYRKSLDNEQCSFHFWKPKWSVSYFVAATICDCTSRP